MLETAETDVIVFNENRRQYFITEIKTHYETLIIKRGYVRRLS